MAECSICNIGIYCIDNLDNSTPGRKIFNEGDGTFIENRSLSVIECPLRLVIQGLIRVDSTPLLSFLDEQQS